MSGYLAPGIVVDSRELYLALLKKILTGTLTTEAEIELVRPADPLKAFVARTIQKAGFRLARCKRVDVVARTEGRDWPINAFTMVGLKRLENLQNCIEIIAAERIPGDFIETGVWRGGASIFMRAVADTCGAFDRHLWLADSFCGLPAPDPRYPQDRESALHMARELAVGVDQVRANFAAFGFLDHRVRFLEGLFADTLPSAPVTNLSLMRLDGDMYSSTMDALVSLYPKLSVGGFVVIDDYNAIPGCKQAVHDFRRRDNIVEPIEAIDWSGVFWRRSN